MKDILDEAMERTGIAPAKEPNNGRASEHHDENFRPHVVSRRMSDVEPVSVSWLWPDRIPYGKMTLLAGDPGLGKSFVTLDIAARLSSGTPWPDRGDESVEPENTVILSAEDDAADTIRPRLDAAGADVSRIHYVDGVRRSSDGGDAYFNFDDDMLSLERLIKETAASLVIVDPISAYLSKRDSHNNSDIRGILGPLGDMAGRNGCAIIVVTHLNKSSGSRALYRSMGSLAFAAAARIAWLIAQDNDDPARRLMLPMKSNLIEQPAGIAYHLEDGQVRWHDEKVAVDADSVLGVDTREQSERNDAATWLAETLAIGPMPVKEIEQAAEAECITRATLRRAKKLLGVKSLREGGVGSSGKWTWALRD